MHVVMVVKRVEKINNRFAQGGGQAAMFDRWEYL